MLFGGFPSAVCLTRGVSTVHVSVSVVSMFLSLRE